MDSSNEAPLDYYLLPKFEMTTDRLGLAEDNGFILDAFRFNSLEFFFAMAERVRIVEIDIAEADQEGLLRGRIPLTATRPVEQRQRTGKAAKRGSLAKGHKRILSRSLVRAYTKEADRQRLMVQKAELTNNRLLFVVEAFRTLLSDTNFVTLLRAEGLATMPRPLADLISARDAR